MIRGCWTVGQSSQWLYYKHILMIVSDDHKWCLYYKCVIDDASLAS